jgi:hypothetical protein
MSYCTTSTFLTAPAVFYPAVSFYPGYPTTPTHYHAAPRSVRPLPTPPTPTSRPLPTPPISSSPGLLSPKPLRSAQLIANDYCVFQQYNTPTTTTYAPTTFDRCHSATSYTRSSSSSSAAATVACHADFARCDSAASTWSSTAVVDDCLNKPLPPLPLA